MLGAFAVGKTSLVERFVRSIFSEKYLTTIGVKIDKKSMRVGAEDLTLVLWDLQGDDEFAPVQMSYLRGASGYLLVADGTRRSTFDKALELKARADAVLGAVPFVLLLNKRDLSDAWELETSLLNDLAGRGWATLETSAKTGEGVDEAFLRLGREMLQG